MSMKYLYSAKMEQSWQGSWVAEGRGGYGAAELSDGLRKIERIVLSGY